MTTVAEFTLTEGDRVPFVLTWFPSHRDLPDEVDPEQALRDTEEYWHEWADTCEHDSEYHDEIHQSLLVLKALTFSPTAASSPRRRRRCPSTSAASATGTTASAGFATRP